MIKKVMTAPLVGVEYLYNFNEGVVIVKEGTSQERIDEILEEVQE